MDEMTEAERIVAYMDMLTQTQHAEGIRQARERLAARRTQRQVEAMDAVAALLREGMSHG